MTDLRLDIRYGIRTLSRTPGFTLVALITLGLGIGATTAMFSVLDTALRRSLPFPGADRLVLGRATFSGNVNPWASFPDYMDYRDQSESLSSLATIGGGSLLVTITGTGEPEQARITSVTSNLFSTLGVVPHLGGSFTIEERPAAGGGEVVISHGFWQRWFGGSADVLGRSLPVNGDPMTVVGVLPAGFRFLYDSDLWVPPWPGNSNPITRRYHNWLLVGRLAPGVSLEAAQSEIDVISTQLEEAYPDSNRRKALRLDNLHTAMVEGYRQSLLVLAGAIVLVLLIACGNVANLFLARGSTRTSELAVRAALGATRSHITRQLLVECTILALLAGGLGIVLAVWLQNLIVGFVSMDLLGIEEVGLSLTMLGIGLVLSLITVLLFGVFPSLAAARTDPAEQLKHGSRGSTSGSGIRYRSGLVALQVALSVVLLVGSGLLIRSFARLRGVDPGFRVENLLTATVSLPSDDYQQANQRIQFFEGLRERIEALPGVETVGMVTRLPILQTAGNVAIWAPERPPETNNDAPWADRRIVLPGYFATMGIPLVEGRVFQANDVAGSAPVIVLSRTTAEAVYPEFSAVGRQVAVDVGSDEPGLFEVVGVVEDHQTSSLAGTPRPAMFFPYAQQPAGTMRLAVATAADPKSLIRPIQERVWELDRDIVLSDVQTMEEAISNSIADTRSVTTVLGMFAAVALALAALGIYGVLAFFVTQRVQEIGIRVALGASAGSVLRLVIGRGMMLVAVGLLLGAAGAVAATRLVEGMLFQIGATDPVTFAGVTVFFLIVALGACLLPAWRALRVDPLETLRVE
ncbi:MAG: ABC transporter permease [Gemmatimonadales bacterium]